MEYGCWATVFGTGDSLPVCFGGNNADDIWHGLTPEYVGFLADIGTSTFDGREPTTLLHICPR